MTPSGRIQALVDFLSGVGLCVVAMRKAFTILGALLIAGVAVQTATASERHMRAGRGHHHWDYRVSYNQLNEPSYAAPQMRDGYSEGSSKPPANETQSCDNVWCYAD
jgi:hypothetical protein